MNNLHGEGGAPLLLQLPVRTLQAGQEAVPRQHTPGAGQHTPAAGQWFMLG